MGGLMSTIEGNANENKADASDSDNEEASDCSFASDMEWKKSANNKNITVCEHLVLFNAAWIHQLFAK